MNHKFMSKPILSLIFATITLVGVLVSLQAMPDPKSSDQIQNKTIPTEGITLLHSDENGLSFILAVTKVESSKEGEITSPVLNSSFQDPGAPELPYYSTFIAIPPEAQLSIGVVQRGVNSHLNSIVQAAAEPIVSNHPERSSSQLEDTTAIAQPKTRIQDPAIFAKDELFPNFAYQLSEPVYFRDMRLVKLDLFPLQFNPQSQLLQQATSMEVNIRFDGANLENLKPAPSKNDAYQSSIADTVLNFEQGKSWRSLPQSEQDIQINSLTETAVSLPLGSTSYKIEINQDGIYDLLGSDLAAAGMDIGSVNPTDIQMMSRGKDVAYEFIKVGSNNSILESNDIVRFYGEGVNGTRREKQFLNYNVYWLWTDGTATSINNELNNPGATTVTTFLDSITREDEDYFFATWTNKWDEDYENNAWNDFPNEPDSWYWDFFSAGTKSYSVELPDPVIEAGKTATYTVEIMTKEYLKNYSYEVDVCLNTSIECTERSWTGHRNVNIVESIPVTSLLSGTNEFTVTLSGSSGVLAYLNRITVDYERTLIAKNDQLFFTDEVGGRAMVIQDFSENNLDNILVWDITTPRTPTQIQLEAGDIAEENGRYTYTIGINNNAPQQYIATTTDNVLSIPTEQISAYTAPTNLEPTAGADWIAITHKNFITPTNTLATHRQQADYGDYSTHVIDIEDIINVYGSGLATTDAITNYLKTAIENWSTKPSYLVLVGDATISPRNLPCQGGCIDGWDENSPTFVLTDLQFKGRFQGLIPSDNSLVFLFGENEGENDLIPDMAVGRLTVADLTQANNLVDKIIKYEENLLAESSGHKRILFLADFPDNSAGGDFCENNIGVANATIPSDYEKVHLCIDDYTDKVEKDPLTFQIAIQTELAQGISIMNYRGHGAFQYWGSPVRFWNASVDVTDQTIENSWGNNNKPVIILSADCQDGHFAWPRYPSISERFLRVPNVSGSMAHWGSAGLGYDHEHTVLLEGFYKGVFEQDLFALGDAINYAKLYFMQSGSYAESELYNFNLQGDPATLSVLPDNSEHDNYLPFLIK